MTTLSDFTTSEEEFPIIYANNLAKQQIIFTFLIDDNKKKIPGKYLYIIQDMTTQEITSTIILDSLDKVNTERNNAIRNGYKFYILPKVVTKPKEIPKEVHLPKKPRVYRKNRK